jgi:hypothetical protein
MPVCIAGVTRKVLVNPRKIIIQEKDREHVFMIRHLLAEGIG